MYPFSVFSALDDTANRDSGAEIRAAKAGDAAATEEAQALLGDIEVATVKEGLGINSAICMSPVKSPALIREKATRAVERAKPIKP